MSEIKPDRIKDVAMEKVSVIIPVLNEKLHVQELIETLCEQDYPKECLEFLFVDGGSKDESKELIRHYCEEKGLPYSVLDNPNRTAPYAFNLGIEKANGSIIVILSAHSIYQKDYISNCVKHLLESDADNVGGFLRTIGRGFIGQCNAAVLTSWFGVGGSDFRLTNETKYVDTVPFGTFRKSLIEKIGGFNTELSRSEDNEFNYRIRKNGGKILMISDVEIGYYCRDSVKELVKMGFANGKGVGYTAIRYPDVLKLKYFIPMLFVFSLVFCGLFSLFSVPLLKYLFWIELAVYGLCDLYFTLKTKVSAKGKLIVFFLFPLFHISYGCGTIRGIISGLMAKKKYNSGGSD